MASMASSSGAEVKSWPERTAEDRSEGSRFRHRHAERTFRSTHLVRGGAVHAHRLSCATRWRGSHGADEHDARVAVRVPERPGAGNAGTLSHL